MATSFGSIGSASVEINANLKGLTKELARARVEVTSASRRIETSFERIERQGQRLNRSFVGLGRAARTLRTSVAGIALAFGGRGFIRLADTFSGMERQLELVTDSSEQLAEVQERLFRIAQNTRQPLEDVTRLFGRFALVTKESGLSQEELLNGVEAVSAAVVQTGVTAREASAGLQQLSQGFGKARLDGDELRSVLENIPILGEAIAKELDTTVAALRDLGAEGSIGRGVQIRAFRRLRSELGDLSEVPLRVSESVTVLKNALLVTVGEADKASGASQNLAESIVRLADAIDDPAFVEFTTGFLTILVNSASKAAETVAALVGEFERLQQADISELRKEFQETGEVAETFGDVISKGFVGGIDRAVNKLRAVANETSEFFGGDEIFSGTINGLGTLEGMLDSTRLAARFAAEETSLLNDEIKAINDSVSGSDLGGRSIDDVEQDEAIQKTTKAIAEFIVKMEQQSEVARLSAGSQREFGQALRNLGVDFDEVGGKVANIEGSFEGLGRLRSLIEQASLDELTQSVTDYVTELARQNEITGITSESQRRLAETLQQIGVAFELVGGQVRSATLSQERLAEIQEALDAEAYAELREGITEYITELERATALGTLQTDQQREMAEALDSLGVEWKNVGGQIKALSDVLDEADFERITAALDTARLQEAQQKLDDFLETAKENRDVAALTDETQRRYAETLRNLGIEFEIVDGSVRVLNEDIMRTGELLEGIDAERAAERLKELEEIGRQFGSSVESALADVIIEGRKLEDVLDSLIKQFARMALQQAIGGGSGGGGLFGGLFTGLVTSIGGQTVGGSGTTGANGVPFPFARGGIVTGPVDIAGGRGVMGEAGAEAIVPLARTRSGNLGIETSGLAGGGGTEIQIIDQRGSGADIEVQTVREDGREIVRAIVRDQVGDMIGTGAIDDGLGRFGISRQGVPR